MTHKVHTILALLVDMCGQYWWRKPPDKYQRPRTPYPCPPCQLQPSHITCWHQERKPRTQQQTVCTIPTELTQQPKPFPLPPWFAYRHSPFFMQCTCSNFKGKRWAEILNYYSPVSWSVVLITDIYGIISVCNTTADERYAGINIKTSTIKIWWIWKL